MIKQEFALLKNLDHPNIANYHEQFEDELNLYLVMELCSGGELFDKMVSSAFGERDAAAAFRSLFQAIHHCHTHGIVHRDLKPENLMIAGDGELKIIDFGLSRDMKGTGGLLMTLVGSPYYIAPEIIAG